MRHSYKLATVSILFILHVNHSSDFVQVVALEQKSCFLTNEHGRCKIDVWAYIALLRLQKLGCIMKFAHLLHKYFGILHLAPRLSADIIHFNVLTLLSRP